VLARRPIDAAVVGFSSGEMVPGKIWQGLMSFGNHTRAGTVPDRRGRCGMRSGGSWSCAVGRCWFRSVQSWSVKSRLVKSNNQARAGTGPDQRRRLGMRNGMSRCRSALVGHGWQSSVRARFVALVLGTAIAVGAVRLRRLVAGCVWLRPGWSRYGGASPVLVRINPPS
jgi:hypothetical protein